MKTKDIALIALFGSTYLVLGLIFQPISFMAIQVRVACALIPLITLFGTPATIGITIGGLIFNSTSPLGLLDLLSMFIFLPAKYAIQKYGVKAVPLHILSVALWVSFMLNNLFNIPYFASVLTVGLGEAVAELGLGIPLLYAIERRLK